MGLLLTIEDSTGSDGIAMNKQRVKGISVAQRDRIGVCSAVALFGIISVLSSSTGCSTSSVRTNPGLNSEWLRSGSIGLSRPVPQRGMVSESQPLLGFIPSKHTQSSSRVVIDKAAKSISLTSNLESREIASGIQCDLMTAGTYTVALKQQSPVWYAPDSYFEAREVPVPPSGSSERFRRGALGQYAIFLNNQAPLHSGPISSTEIGGVQLEEELVAHLFETLQVGTVVEIK